MQVPRVWRLGQRGRGEKCEQQVTVRQGRVESKKNDYNLTPKGIDNSIGLEQVKKLKSPEDKIDRVAKESEELLESLNSISSATEDTRQKNQNEIGDQKRSPYGTQTNNAKINGSGAAAAWVLVVLLIAAGIAIFAQAINNRSMTATGSQDLAMPENGGRANQTDRDTSSTQASDQVTFNGISLPVTNTLCNKKKNFCIYGLAGLVNEEQGNATYQFSDNANGEQVQINGKIMISRIQRDSSGNRNIEFNFEDNQSNTTPDWAAAGVFMIGEDTNQPGIKTTFKTVTSYGSKTPLGLENNSYVFPQS